MAAAQAESDVSSSPMNIWQDNSRTPLLPVE